MPLSDETRKKLYAFLKNEPGPAPASDTKTNRERKQEFEKRFGYRTPTAELVARIEAAERIIWIPCGYVLFVRKATCRNCGATQRCLDVPQLFLQSRKERRDDSNPYLYTAVKEIEYWNLPRRLIVKPVTSPFCEACFEDPISCQRSSSSCRQEDTQSLTENSEKSESSPPDSTLQLTQALEEGLLQSSPPSLSPLSIPPGELGGLPSETVFGSVCEEREFAKTVIVDE